ncbi:hypothetical protein ACFPVX_17675 [Cohnella faecalis]|uniref:Uncharacterized protein n=1 Tax=Cohnella faecalis TaxID=2315694 RepID=A0A398CKF9_9BACL|nr:hypothetical protein [Cohnella faecalis]RIE01689.1 hypothetical protein D3H35_24180 [Cohnella faecalis]
MKTMETRITENLLRFCYPCPHADECTTEEDCRACWAERAAIEDEEEEGPALTRRLLRECEEI